MYVIAKYNPNNTAEKPSVMELFRNNLCSIDVTNSGTVCHGIFSDEVFSEWFTSNNLGEHEWQDVETKLVSDATIVIKGGCLVLNGYEIYTAENESVISTAQAKASGLWSQILDKLYEEAARS